MGQPIPAQHPSVVLRSHFKLVKTLLGIAMVAVIALAATVVILANDEDQVSGGSIAAKPAESINYSGFNPATGKPDTVQQQPQTPAGTRYDGGPEEGTRAVSPAPSSIAASAESAYQNLRSPAARYDGGPEEGTRGPVTPSEPNTGFKARSGGPRMIPQGPGAR